MNKITELKKGIGLNEEEISKYNSLQKDLENINTERNKIINDYKKLSKFNRDFENQIIELKRQKDLVSLSLETIEIKSEFEKIFLHLESLIPELNSFIKFTETKSVGEGKSVFIYDNVFKSLLDANSTKKQKNEKDLEPYRKNAEVEKNIKSLEISIEEDRKNLNSIIQINKEIETYNIELINEKNKLFDLYKKSYREYINIVQNLKERVKVLEKDGLIIKGLVKFNFPKFRNNMLEISHGGSKTYKKWDIFEESFSALHNYDVKKFINDIKEVFVSIDEGEYALLSKIDKAHAIKNLLDDYFFDYWEIEYKGDKLGKMSTGKASFVILMMIVGLSESKSPILINQPEDNLDNRSVSNDLVEYLKEKKKERQIILVTHNPNIVVNADAENIIVANQKGQNIDDKGGSPYQFDYINGALENSFLNNKNTDLLKSMGIREHIADIVEGGKEAFKKREEKYGF